MSDLNQYTITGRLGADPETRRKQDGKPIVNMRVAVSEQWRDANGERKERTEWVTAVIFSEGLCKVAESYLKKGSKVLLQGKIATRKWSDQSGNDRYSTELILQGFDAKLIMLDGPSGGKPEREQTGYDYQDEPRKGGAPANFDDLDQISFAPAWR